MPKGALNGDDVTAGADQAGRVEVPEVVQPEAAQAGGSCGGPPAVADGVLVRRVCGSSAEDPSAVRAVRSNVGGKQVDQSGCQEDRALAAVLRRADLDGAAARALDLAGDGEPAAEEVDVVDPDCGCLAEP